MELLVQRGIRNKKWWSSAAACAIYWFSNTETPIDTGYFSASLLVLHLVLIDVGCLLAGCFLDKGESRSSF